jgi:hypothetical protein
VFARQGPRTRRVPPGQTLPHVPTYVRRPARKSFHKTLKNTLFDGFGLFLDLKTAFSIAQRPSHPSDVKLGKRESRCFLTFLKVFDRF